jgi:hypothetical protein
VTLPGPTLRAGTLYQVPVPRAEELRIDALVAQRLRPTSPAAQVVLLPGVGRQLDTKGREVNLKGFVLPGQPLTYREGSRRFEGTILVGVADVLEASAGRPLSASVTFQVLEAGMAQPDSVALEQTSPPLKPIQVWAASPTSTVTLRVASQFAPEGARVVLPVQPTLLVRVDRREIQGYGLETTVAHIAAYGLAKPGGREVQLAAEPSGFFEKSHLTLNEQGTASTVLRSDGAGPVRISASAAGLTPGTAELEFATPTRTLFAALLGGLLGGLLRLLPAMRRGMRASRLFIGLLGAVASGVLVFLLYAVGVNVLPVAPTVTVGTVLVLAVSALGAWFGAGLLKGLKGAGT